MSASDYDPVDRTAENAQKFVESNDYVIFGTPIELNEEEFETGKKIKRKEDMIATDEKGRRRFHGAFTGGFSAGYFNTCGSEQGWTPSTFVSSRENRKITETQDPEFYMDEEDFSEFGIAPKKYSARSEFNIKKTVIKNEIDESMESHKTLRSLVSDNFLYTSLNIVHKVAIGYDLMKKIGWKEGRGVGELVSVPSAPEAKKKTYGCQLPPHLVKPKPTQQVWIAPKEEKFKIPNPKTNLFGIGYVSLRSEASIMNENKNDTSSFKPTGYEKKGIKGVAHGIGAFDEFEESDQIYHQDKLDDYDYSIDVTNLSQSLGRDNESERKLWHGFVRPKKKTELTGKQYNLPDLPNNYKPKPVLGPDVSAHYSTTSRVAYDSRIRAMLLKKNSTEENVDKRFKSSNMDNITSEHLKKRFVTSGQVVAESVEESSQKNKIEAAKAGMFGKLTRVVVDWLPTEVLCRRFNVVCVKNNRPLEPKFSKNSVPSFTIPKAAPKTAKPQSQGPLSILNPGFVKEEVNEPVLSKPVLKETSPEKVDSGPVLYNDDDKPSIDLFKAVFCDDSDDEKPLIDKQSSDKRNMELPRKRSKVLDVNY